VVVKLTPDQIRARAAQLESGTAKEGQAIQMLTNAAQTLSSGGIVSTFGVAFQQVVTDLNVKQGVQRARAETAARQLRANADRQDSANHTGTTTLRGMAG
jgi:hypothetical protein